MAQGANVDNFALQTRLLICFAETLGGILRQYQHVTRQARDYGTPELVRKRAELTKGADPAMSWHPLSIYHVQGYLSPDPAQSQRMHDAGQEFGALYERCRAIRGAVGSHLGRLGGSSQDPDVATWQAVRAAMTPEELLKREAEDRARFHAARASLKDLHCWTALLEVVVYRSTSGRWLEGLRTALCRLVVLGRTG